MSHLVEYSDSESSDEDGLKVPSKISVRSCPESESKSLQHSEKSVPEPPFPSAIHLESLEGSGYGLASNNLQTTDEPAPKKSKDCNKPQTNQHHSSGKCTKSQGGNGKSQVLTLPSAIQSMFTSNSSRSWTDDPSLHGNRKRSFPHVEGNWATHVFIPVRKDEKLISFVHQLIRLFDPFVFEMSSEFHISLSRTVVIRHHWIEPLIECLRDKFSSIKSCVGDLNDIKFYSNDEKTRTFLCIEVAREDTALLDYVELVDKSFSEFKLPQYYQDPSFHLSVAWCVGDVRSSLPKEKLIKAKEMLGSFCAANPELSVVFAKDVCCRSGNKSFMIPLIV